MTTAERKRMNDLSRSAVRLAQHFKVRRPKESDAQKALRLLSGIEGMVRRGNIDLDDLLRVLSIIHKNPKGFLKDLAGMTLNDFGKYEQHKGFA